MQPSTHLDYTCPASNTLHSSTSDQASTPTQCMHHQAFFYIVHATKHSANNYTVLFYRRGKDLVLKTFIQYIKKSTVVSTKAPKVCTCMAKKHEYTYITDIIHTYTLFSANRRQGCTMGDLEQE